MQHEIIGRSEAALQGRRFFYTGKPCKDGQDDRRYVSTGACCSCVRERGASAGRILRRFDTKPFTYPLHPEDHARVLAYCHAVDLERGRVPFAPKAAPLPAVAPSGEVHMPEWLVHRRAEIEQMHAPQPAAPYLPKP